MTKPILSASLLPLLALAGCSLAPHYARPEVAAAPTWKPVDGWQPANPSDQAPRADWWSGFGDATLDDLIVRAHAHNQTIAQAAASYRQARATTREARASLFPTVSASGSVTHSESGGSRTIVTNGVASPGGGNAQTSYRVGLDGSWQPDLFGQIANTVANARATEQARRADLASAQLAIDGELATNYLGLRATDAQIASLSATVAAYQRSLQIATNRYNAGIAPHSDVFQGQSQLASARSDLEGQKRTRAQFEDAIAVLVGENAAAFTLAAVPGWSPATPDVPVAIPSTLLERRPDIAAAERQVAAANAQIGVDRAAFFPALSLTGSGGFNNNTLSGLFSSAASLWSVGASLAQTIFDAGARRARVAADRAAYDAAVANYRQVTLTAFQDVQDNLAATAILARQEALLREASVAADRSEASVRFQYQSGIVVFTDVVSAQATALSARRALIQIQSDRQTIAVALIQALGGGWQAGDPTAR
ncbi:efflux transporter outer membrane subunit [Sphingomonas populi]|uniref:Efflux transporter outer membrane subunit n=1 Tax=Sphingomonas populi TaxID=2484750 RepID=A0A4V2DDS2_9SPHN|nr:efflux transporter outer membrane subunit [Sphingomonas populi]RZF65978.1 efflux transporter outer membrane subunit [Sphingomonas populi]